MNTCLQVLFSVHVNGYVRSPLPPVSLTFGLRSGQDQRKLKENVPKLNLTLPNQRLTLVVAYDTVSSSVYSSCTDISSIAFSKVVLLTQNFVLNSFISPLEECNSFVWLLLFYTLH